MPRIQKHPGAGIMPFVNICHFSAKGAAEDTPPGIKALFSLALLKKKK